MVGVGKVYQSYDSAYYRGCLTCWFDLGAVHEAGKRSPGDEMTQTTRALVNIDHVDEEVMGLFKFRAQIIESRMKRDKRKHLLPDEWTHLLNDARNRYVLREERWNNSDLLYCTICTTMV